MFRRVTSTLLSLILLLLCLPLLADEAKDDAKLLDGRWDGVGLELDGKKIPGEPLKAGGWEFRGLEVEFFGPGPAGGGKASVKLDLSKTPKHIDIVGLEGPLKEKKIEGIFKIEKDQLIICLRGSEEAAKGRPTEFKTEVGGGLGLITLKRAKKGAELSEKEKRQASIEKMKQLGIAMHTHHDVFKLFPAQSIKKDDKPLLSWRVKLLMFLGEQPLYDKFNHDEPWDSEHNKKLIDRMPAVFASPYHTAEMTVRGLTLYQVPVFKGSLFDEDSPFSFAQIRDGVSHTVLVVETDVDNGVVWTKPDDWQVDGDNPHKGIAKKKGKGFLALFADGSVQLMNDAMDAESLKLLLGRDDGKGIAAQTLILKE